MRHDEEPLRYIRAVPFAWFEPACVAIVVLTLAFMARTQPLRPLAMHYVALAIAGFVGEETCIRFYDFYHYSDAWHGRIDCVPVMVPLIWPLVILSARSVADAVAPKLGRARPLLVGALVIFDASLVEVIAVRAHLWSWVEPGHLHVPILGILGWGFFAIGADIALSQRAVVTRGLGLVGALLFTHVMIVLAWWACFRWTLRGELGDASMIGLGVLSAIMLFAALRARSAGHTLPLAIALPRMIAASLFIATLLVVAPHDARLWLHTAAVAVPYLAVTDFVSARTRRPVGLRESTAPSQA